MKNKLLQNATLFTITLSAWGNRKKIDSDKVKTTAEKSRVNATKKLIESPEYDAIVRFQTKTKNWCVAHSMPSFIKDGVYFVSLKSVEKFETTLCNAKPELEALVNNLVQKFPDQKEAARIPLDDLYDENDYPSIPRLRASFDIQWNWLQFSVPDNIPEEVRERESKKLHKNFADAQQEIIAALRAYFSKIVTHAVDRLTIVPGKNPPVFHDSLLKNFEEFFETFQSRNLMDDTELAAVVGQAKSLLSGVDGDTLRKKANVRKEIATAFSAVKTAVDKLIQERPSRKLNLED